MIQEDNQVLVILLLVCLQLISILPGGIINMMNLMMIIFYQKLFTNTINQNRILDQIKK